MYTSSTFYRKLAVVHIVIILSSSNSAFVTLEHLQEDSTLVEKGKKKKDLHDKMTKDFLYNELSQKNRFQSVPIAALCLYNIQRENLGYKKSLYIL